MPAPIDRDRFEPKIDRREMTASGNAALAKDRGGEQTPEPRRMLQDGDLIPRIEGDDRLKDRWQILGASQHGLPLRQPLVLIPVKVVNERILFRSVFDTARLLRLFNSRFRAGNYRIDRGKRVTQTVCNFILHLPHPGRSTGRLNIPIRHPLPVFTP